VIIERWGGNKVRLEGKRVLVVGGAGGLGSAIVQQMASAGAKLAVADIDLDAAKSVADRVAPASALHIDVTSRPSVDAAFASACVVLGGLDVLVYAAGVARHRHVTEVLDADWAHAVGVNMTGAFHCCQRAAREMIGQGTGGSIIAIASVASARHGSGTSVYSASKAGLAAFVHAIAVDLAPSGIRASVVDPGPVETDLVRTAHSEAFRHAYERAIPMGRYGQPREIAGAVLFLASDEASYVTGSTITVDGGFSHAGAIG